ncbi:MAG: PqiC family protein, partial [Frateuria sp.]
MIRTRHLLAAALALGLAACASEPARYYTLLAPAPAEAGMTPSASFNFELMPVGIPAQVDQPPLVI